MEKVRENTHGAADLLADSRSSSAVDAPPERTIWASKHRALLRWPISLLSCAADDDPADAIPADRYLRANALRTYQPPSSLRTSRLGSPPKTGATSAARAVIGTPLDAHNVRRAFRGITKTAGLGKTWSPRELRHTFVSIMSDNDVPVEKISDPSGTTAAWSPSGCTVTSSSR